MTPHRPPQRPPRKLTVVTGVYLALWLAAVVTWKFLERSAGSGGLAAVLPAVLAVAAWFNRGLLNELLALAIGVMFLLFTVHAWQWALRPASGQHLAPSTP